MAVEVDNIEDIYELSPMQRGMLFHTLYAPHSGVYMEQALFSIGGAFDFTALREAWQRVVAQHTTLRTAFLWEELDEPMQVVYQSVEVPWTRYDWRELASADQQSKLEELVAADRMLGFDLAQPPLLRLTLLHITNDTHFFLLTHHHLLLDGWSLTIVLQEAISTYEALRTGQEPRFKSRRPYQDYIGWLHRQNLAEAEAFWRHYLQGFTVPTPLMLANSEVGDEPGEPVSLPSQQDLAAKRELRLRGGRPVELQGITLSQEITTDLNAFARRHQLTLNTLVQGAWALLLSLYNVGADHAPDSPADIVFGATVAGRPADLVGAEAMVGLFINTLPVRVQVTAQSVLLPWLKQLQAQQAAARQYDYTPLVQVHGWSEVPRGQSLFESLVVFENYQAASMEAPGNRGPETLRLRFLQSLEQTNYPLVLVVVPGPEMEILLGYEIARFAPAAMRRALGFLRTLLKSFVANPQARLADISLLDEAERQQMLSRWPRVEDATIYQQDVMLTQLFQLQVSRTPDAIALSCDGTDEEGERVRGLAGLTYAELDRRSNQLAHYLRRSGVGPEVRVGLFMERSLELMIGLLGILKAGGAYVPLDPGYPPERLAFMLADIQPLAEAPSLSLGDRQRQLSFVLTQHTLQARLSTLPAQVTCLDSAWSTIEQECGDPPQVSVLPGNAAYVIYTSGSTGSPKGAVVPHLALLNHCVAVSQRYQLHAGDRVLHFASISFDVALEELFPAWLHGATVVIWPQAVAPSGAEFSRFAAAEQLTVLNLPSSYWHEWVSELLRSHSQPPPSLRCMIVGSEKVSPAHVNAWRDLVRQPVIWYNAYGLTETTITALLYQLPPASEAEPLASLPLGRPIANTQVYILDARMQPVPVGMPGELYIGGAGLARGYLHRPELTAERFVPDPFVGTSVETRFIASSSDLSPTHETQFMAFGPGARLYKTGDLARYREDGNIEFLGRVDSQVKLRGFRIELGEIEMILNQHAPVKDAVVLAREDTPNAPRLVAYIIPARPSLSLVTQLRAYLQDRLPTYMIPAAFVLLDTFPRGPSGKINYRALPAPEQQHATVNESYVAPRTPIEEILAGIWAAVLQLERVSRLDNFFKLGGHSLQATQVVARLREVLRIELPVRAIYDAPTILALASSIEKIKQRTKGQALPAIQPADRSGPLPLSFAQQRLWFLDQLQADSPLYNIPGSFLIKGALDVRALEQSLNDLVQRHEPLRTTFAVYEEQPVQIIAPTLYLPLTLVDLAKVTVNTGRNIVARLANEEAQRPFNLQQGPLVRVTLLRLNVKEHVLLLTLHHIVADGWSAEIFFHELDACYIARTTGVPAQLPALPVQYADYALWQQQWLQGGVIEQQLTYWRTQLAGIPPALDLPTDYPRPAIQTFHGARYSFSFSRALSTRLKALSQQEGVTLFMTLLAALQTLLFRYSGQTDIVVGTPIAGRTRIEVERLIGFFINTLVLRADLSGNPRFKELLLQVREMTLAAYSHQDLPFEKLVEELQLERSLSQSPLFQVLFVLQNISPRDTNTLLASQGLSLEPLEISSGTAKFDLAFELVETPEDLAGHVEYNTDLFEAMTIQRMIGHYKVMLESIVADPEQCVTTLSLLTPAENMQLLQEWNSAYEALPQYQCLHSLFEEQAEKMPDKVAVVFEGQQLTYQELDERANRLAHLLLHHGIGPKHLIGLCLPRTPDLVIGLLAILKTGAAYVPLDPTYPRERLAFTVQDARLTLVLTQADLLGHMPFSTDQALCLDNLELYIGESSDNMVRELSNQNLAYVLYTSGSTGRPKGVCISHWSAVAFLHWVRQQFSDEELAGVLFGTSICFDLSIFELFAPLCWGGKVILASTVLDLSTLAEYETVTLLNTVPSAAIALLNGTGLPPTLLTINLAGEALSRELVQSLYQQCSVQRINNLYGPTEDTTYSIWATMSIEEQGWVPIGRPLAQTQAYIVDAYMQPVPIGVAGELYLGGDGLAQGYLNRPDLTAERFVPDPFSPLPGRRLYQTGDQARYRSDGTIYYLGRLDHQVKIRGYRIEPGEIEALLGHHPDVAEVVVLAREDTPGEKRLVAYVVPSQASTAATGAQQLRHYLQAQLPDYMVPAHFVFLDALPLTPNGKVDRRILPAPEVAERVQGDKLPPAQTLVEAVLIAIWSDLLHIGRVGVQDNFFELGGHSLLATRQVARLREAFQVEIPLRAVFEAPTLGGLAARIEAARGNTSGVLEIPPLLPRSQGSILPLSYAQERLWFLHQLEPESPAYNIPVTLQIQGDLDIKALRDSLNALSRRHEALRTIFTVADGIPQQTILPQLRVDLRIKDLSDLQAEIRQQELYHHTTRDISQPFNLGMGPLLRALLLRMSECEHVLLLTIHHSIVDGWSTSILVNELNAFYQAIVAGEPVSLPSLPVQYADYALWQRQWLQGEVLEQEIAYWRNQLVNAPTVLNLPTDHPRPTTQTYRGDACFIALSPTLSRELYALSQRKAVTLFMTLLAAFQVLLFRYSGQADIVVGTPIAGRGRSELEGLIGLFINTLALRVDLSGDPSFHSLLGRVREVCLEAYAHQDLPFGKVVEAVQPERSLSHHPLFQVMFIVQNAPVGMQFIESADNERNVFHPYPLELSNATTKFDLTVELMDSPGGVHGIVEYNTDLFERETIQRLVRHYQTLLEAIVANSNEKLSLLPLLDESERRGLLIDWNATTINTSSDVRVHRLFEDQVARTPYAIALSSKGQQGEQVLLTYQELNQLANQFAYTLRAKGVGPEVPVALYLERSPAMVIAVLSVLKAGGAYLPLDKSYPGERLAFMLQETQAPVVLTNQRMLQDLPPYQGQVICLDSYRNLLQDEELANPSSEISGANLAYIIYTSGSTGRPKGVMVTHQGLSNYLAWCTRAYRVEQGRGAILHSSLASDLSVTSLFAPLLTGRRLEVLPEEQGIEALGNALREARDLSLVKLTPAHLTLLADQLANEKVSGRAQVFVIGGEALRQEHVTFWQIHAPELRLVNEYGPTETVVGCCVYELAPGEIHPETATIPIGRPIAHTRLYLLDQALQPV
ncbi:MAG TPA: amino acid adenylation domain-containing protein, partial [Ktedonobacteraceae bacterium]|nr:amino acid adenylation domain-containing protein [Ktedonobacteraceae bacterium]